MVNKEDALTSCLWITLATRLPTPSVMKRRKGPLCPPWNVIPWHCAGLPLQLFTDKAGPRQTATALVTFAQRNMNILFFEKG
jgi:hypothetical protein